MGNTHPSHEDLVNVRGWSAEQIGTVYDILRRRNMSYTLNKEEFSRYVGGRHREANTIFADLDTDYDGKVDIFEVLVVLAIWSGTNWEEKQELLFMFFDMMDKRFLKIDEVMLMGTILVQTMNKFVKLPPHYGKLPYLKELAELAFTDGTDKLDMETFKEFTNDVEPFEQLKGFIKDQAAKGQAPSVESRMRLQISTLEKHVNTLFERLERLQNWLPEFTDSCIEYVSAWGRRKRWDFVMQNLRQLVLNLHQCAEDMNSTLADLSSSIKEDEASQGLSSVIEPRRRLQQEQMVVEVEKRRQQSLSDFREATELLRRLIEFTEPSEALRASVDQPDMAGINAIREEEAEHLIDMSPPRVVDSRNITKQIYNEMSAEIGEGGTFSRDVDGFHQLIDNKGSDSPKGKDGAGIAGAIRDVADDLPDEIPKLIAIAHFDPPPSHQTQMLPLIVGDIVTVIGQDGRGWWYGKKQNGTEGWFPPSYVQTKSAHFSSADKP
jgi:hypothetical protein